MEMALRRRLDGVVDVRISQERQTADVFFSPGARAFAAAEFRGAVAEAEVEVVRFEIEACGRVEHAGDATWFAAGPNRFLLAPPATAPSGDQCLSADLHDGEHPARLEHVRPR
jgi:hypothetical protein